MPNRRHWRLPILGTTLGTLAVLLIGSVTTVSAAPQRARTTAPADPQPRTASVSASVSMTAKLTLFGETSIAAPGFSSIAGGFEGFSRAVIAWTGTDAAHRLNVMTSATGLTDYTNKVTLRETSPFSPAVNQLEEIAGNQIILAWTGTDASHHVNFLFDIYGARPQKVTLRETSIAGPAIAFATGDLLIAWTGTDANHSLNVLKISMRTLQPVAKRTLPFSSNAGPSLINRGNSAVLGWTTKSNRLNVASSSNGLDFTTVLGAGLPETSAFAPAVVHIQREVQPQDWISWTGTDAAHHLNVEWTRSYPHWPDGATKTVLRETALGGPGIGFDADAGLLLAWTGTDAAHHLNIARFKGF